MEMEKIEWGVEAIIDVRTAAARSRGSATAHPLLLFFLCFFVDKALDRPCTLLGLLASTLYSL